MKAKKRRFKNYIKSEWIFLLTFFIVLLSDKITKIVIKNNFYLGESRSVIGNFFRFTYIENKGIAFGLLSDWSHPFKAILLIFLSLAALYFLISIYIKSRKGALMQLSFGLIFGGAVGNVFDRIFYGKVVDFLDFGIKNYRWPFFNLADTSITIGVMIIFILSIFYDKEIKL